MKTGKLTDSVLKRSVLRQLDTNLSKSRELYGTDGAYMTQAAGASVYTVVNTVPGFLQDTGKLVTAAINNLAAAGADPAALLISALVPECYEERSLKADMQRMASAASAQGMAVLGGHTQVLSDLARPQYSVTGIGTAKDVLFKKNNRLKAGQELVLTKWIALGGTAALAIQYEKKLGERYPFTLVDQAKAFENMMSVVCEAQAAFDFGDCAMHDLSQGGIFGALWEMAEHAGVGLEVDLKKIPVKQETVELCEYFDINPYYFYSAGSLLIGTSQPEALISELAARGVFAAVIGRVTEGNDRIIRNGEEVRFLDRPQQEEWYRRFNK